jgi:tripartite-type tricarboxylate transporter receptor subunit TctC
MKSTITALRALAWAMAACCAIAASGAWAQARYPSRTIQIIVPYPPGGSNDIFARAIAQKLSASLGQPVVVENRGGGGGIVGETALANAPADGYTLAYVSSSFTTSAAVAPRLPFDPITSFAPVALVGKGPMVIAISNQLPAKNLREFVELAKTRKLNYGTSGPGSINHFATEMFSKSAGISMVHIPYRGMGPATSDLMAGHVDVILGSIPSLMSYARAGKARALAVSSDEPSPLVPGLATARSQGVRDFVLFAWSGILAPAGTPPDVVQLLNMKINEAINAPDMKEFLRREGVVEAPTTSANFATLIKEDIGRWKQLAAEMNIKAE